MNIRAIIRYYNKIINHLDQLYNFCRLRSYGIKFGKNCTIHGNLKIKLFDSAKVIIGDNFYCSSGRIINALACHKIGCLYATENAVISIGNNCGMSSPIIWCHKKVTIGNNVKLGANVIIIDTDAHNLDYLKRRDSNTDFGNEKEVKIGDDVLIGMNCIVLKGVSIGDRSVIGAGSVVTTSIPSDCIAAGNPAKIIRKNESSMVY